VNPLGCVVPTNAAHDGTKSFTLSPSNSSMYASLSAHISSADIKKPPKPLRGPSGARRLDLTHDVVQPVKLGHDLIRLRVENPGRLLLCCVVGSLRLRCFGNFDAACPFDFRRPRLSQRIAQPDL